jgi:hypothetical protein
MGDRGALGARRGRGAGSTPATRRAAAEAAAAAGRSARKIRTRGRRQVPPECGIWASWSSGEDTNPGTQAEPVQSLQRAVDLAVEKGVTHVYACEGGVVRVGRGPEQRLPARRLRLRKRLETRRPHHPQPDGRRDPAHARRRWYGPRAVPHRFRLAGRLPLRDGWVLHRALHPRAHAALHGAPQHVPHVQRTGRRGRRARSPPRRAGAARSARPRGGMPHAAPPSVKEERRWRWPAATRPRSEARAETPARWSPRTARTVSPPSRANPEAGEGRRRSAGGGHVQPGGAGGRMARTGPRASAARACRASP